jgi:hypothetical protein
VQGKLSLPASALSPCRWAPRGVFPQVHFESTGQREKSTSQFWPDKGTLVSRPLALWSQQGRKAPWVEMDFLPMNVTQSREGTTPCGPRDL